MCSTVNLKSVEMREDPNIVDILSWRYNLRSSQVENWLVETSWNTQGIEYPLAFVKVVDYLKKLNLITEEEGEDWRQKLFPKK